MTNDQTPPFQPPVHPQFAPIESLKKLFCFGYGYSCERLAAALRETNPDAIIAGTTRDREKLDRLRKEGVKSYIFDYDEPLADPLFILNNTTHLLISTPPDDSGDPALNLHALDILKIPSIEWVGYFSTTGVYGNRNGGWVDERSEIRPTSKRGSRRVKAERQLLEMFEQNGLPVHIFRLSGIYGPTRSAIDSLRAGTARRISKPGHAFNRIHVDDIVQTVMASMARPNPGSIYNLSDDYPTQSHEVIDYACGLMGIEVPPLLNFEEIDMAPMARSFYMDNKRVRNEKIKDELGVKLLYPDYKIGLRGCLDEERKGTPPYPRAAAHTETVHSGGTQPLKDLA